jgi:hypothetical protein
MKVKQSKKVKKIERSVNKSNEVERIVENVTRIQDASASINSSVERLNTFYVQDNMVINPKSYSITSINSKS